MKRKNIYTCILITLMFCITVNVIVNDMAYTLAFIIYCTFLSFVSLVVTSMLNMIHNKYMKELEINTQDIIKNITKFEKIT